MPRTAQPLTARMVDLDALEQFPGNARRGDVEALKQSLEQNTQYKPIVANAGGVKTKNTILTGNHTAQAARELGWRKIRVWWVDVDDTTAARINVADNRHSELGGYDEAALADQLRSLIAADGLTGTGFNDADAAKVLADADAAAADDEDEKPLPAIPIRAKTRRGDVIVLGEHRLMCGDAADGDDVATLLDGAKADLVLTSPPYNVDVTYAGKAEGRAEWDVYGGFLQGVVDAWLRHLAPGRALVWNIGSAPSVYPFRQAVMLEDAGLTYLREVIWKKQGVPLPKWHFTQRNPVARQYTPNPIHELAFVFANAAELAKGEAIGSAIDDVAQHDVLEIHQSAATKDLPTVDGNRTGSSQSQQLATRARKAHPAVFPVRFAEVFIRHLAGPGELVVDPFAGAGTVAIAAQRLGRRAAMMEIQPAYCDVIVERWQAQTGLTAMRPRRAKPKARRREA